MFVLLQNTQGECVGVLLMHIIMIKPHTSCLSLVMRMITTNLLLPTFCLKNKDDFSFLD